MPIPPCTHSPAHQCFLIPTEKRGALHISRKMKPKPQVLFTGSTSFPKLEKR